MSTMAILLATDDWSKMSIFQAFLAREPQAVWRTQGHYTPEYLADIPYPLNLYFFHKSIVGYRANCTGIFRGAQADWHLSLTPPEFRPDTTPYTTFVVIDRLEKIADTHVSSFPKWDNPEERFQRGQFGLLRVRDILTT
jgi:hypothetical protein